MILTFMFMLATGLLIVLHETVSSVMTNTILPVIEKRLYFAEQRRKYRRRYGKDFWRA